MDNMFIAFIEEVQIRHNNRLVMRNLRDSSNPFNIPALEFKKMFRLTRDLAHSLFLQINEVLDNGHSRVTRIPTVIQFFVALHFYSHGSYQKSIEKDRHCSLSQSSVSRCLHSVTDIIVNYFSARFFEQFGFPGVIGAIDGTHVAIVSPAAGGIPPSAICDANLNILSINSRYPGSVHDTAIWQMSTVFNYIRNNYINGDRTSWLLGDSGYPLQPFLLTPIVDADPETPNGRYTYAHIRARNPVERCIGVLKGTFRCLLKDRTLHYKPEFAAQIVVACATLHNILRTANVDNELEEDDNDNVYGMADVDFMDFYEEGIN
ncbi:hypothetical protein NQ317_000078, partial [Molorchus minor]